MSIPNPIAAELAAASENATHPGGEPVVPHWPDWQMLARKVAKVHVYYALLTILLVGAVMVFWMTPSMMLGGGGGPMMVGYMIGSLLIGAVFGVLLSWLLTYLTVLLLYWPVKLTLRLMEWRPAEHRLALFTGGLVALAWMLPHGMTDWPGGPMAIAGQVLLTCLMFIGNIMAGQIGAVLAHAPTFYQQRESPAAAPPPMRFSLWRLMALMVPLCVLLSLLRAVGTLSIGTLVLIPVWFLLQMLTRRPAVWLTLWWLDRQQRRGAALPQGADWRAATPTSQPIAEPADARST
ncbi:hypothetical protein Mal64_19320 [Pseudobythopirellula maris]|uniref:Uncharacterized protein n=1 Tax=Pseudobythopirellula maris TaxID=2527991 RepID=A0A5C5ZNV6_9BACT|nr:hypothetical protein [Pseudobythopirellula maris]TWT88451.1 hypothetical protein Mal64_19320 [Pseudobythopirellula maris]